MENIISNNCTVYFDEKGYDELRKQIIKANYSQIFLIVDSNTHTNCLPTFLEKWSGSLTFEIIEIPTGEAHKTIETCTNTWRTLSDLNADRKSLIINIGGGVTTDLGGFVACTFKRGIDYVNIPTSLLSMVDASVGGKTGVDLDGLKNQVGVIRNPKKVIIDTSYLKTLPLEEKRSGISEMLKHGIISNQNLWEDLNKVNLLEVENLNQAIHQSVQLKNKIVTQDLYENGVRKTLNFGHTLGHAIETYFLEHQTKKTLLHGEAIAIGMILASYISHKQKGLSSTTLYDISKTINNYFDKVDISSEDINSILKFLKYDKKNSHNNINFVLLEAIGKPIWDCIVDEQLILEAFRYYLNEI